jgi:hypothetical protein
VQHVTTTLMVTDFSDKIGDNFGVVPLLILFLLVSD